MKKYTLICIGLCAAMAFTSCKSSESAYKKAYECGGGCCRSCGG